MTPCPRSGVKALYPTYDNFDAIEVAKVVDIPADFAGVMGVPITFLEKWVPDSQYELVKFRHGDDDRDLRIREGEKLRTPYFRVLIRSRRSEPSALHEPGGKE